MDPERWRKIDELYHAALAMDPDRRDAFLRNNCLGDQSLSDEVKSLLLHEQNTATFLNPLDEIRQEAADRLSPEQIQAKLDQAGARYRLIEKLGEGGMGEVYRAEDTRLRRIVALKFITALNPFPNVRARFLREAQAAAALDHPNICPVYGFEEAEGVPFIVMALVDGVSLARRMRDRIMLAEALDWMIGIGEGLKYAHHNGIIHRDIKAPNVILTNSGTPRITDFGLARIEDRSRLTVPGTLMGTVHYMAPEQVAGEDADRRTDIWALGVLFFEILTGRNPFQRSNAKDSMHAIMNDPIPAPSTFHPPLPPDLDRIVNKAISRPRSDRYQYIADFIVDIRAVRRRLTPEQQELMVRRLIDDEATTLIPEPPTPSGGPSSLARPLIGAVVLASILVALLIYWMR